MHISYAQETLDFRLSTDASFPVSMMCRGDGPLSQEVMDISLNCGIESRNLEMLLPDSEGKMNLSFKIQADLKAPKNNYSFSLKGNTPKTQIFSLEMKNTGTRVENKSIKITTPTKTVDIKEVMEEINYFGY